MKGKGEERERERGREREREREREGEREGGSIKGKKAWGEGKEFKRKRRKETGSQKKENILLHQPPTPSP